MQKNKTLETEQGFAFNPSRTEVALFWIYDEVQKKKERKTYHDRSVCDECERPEQ